jgi:protein-tyrosine phosphatase
MFNRILIVCVGNICRSPVAEALLRAQLPDHAISSAGISAVVGSDVDPVAREVAEAAGHVIPEHVARQFTAQMGERADLILVPEARHRKDIEAQAPQLSGRVMLLSHWVGGADIADPYRQSRGVHASTLKQIERAVSAWGARLSARGNE